MDRYDDDDANVMDDDGSMASHESHNCQAQDASPLLVPDPDHYDHVMVVASGGFGRQPNRELFGLARPNTPNSALRFAGSRQIRVGKSVLDVTLLPRAAQNSP